MEVGQKSLVMEEGQTIASAIKNPKKEESRRKKKRLTFVDEVHDTRSEEQARRKELTELFAAKGTNFLTFGLYLVKKSYQQALDIAGVTYNNRKGQLVLADGRGLSTLDLLPSNSAAKREMIFPRYQFNLVRIIVYSEKHNVYFVLARDYAIKVYNKNYNEICSVENPDSRRLTFISFNPVTDEVISGGTKGVQLWKFKEKKFPDYSNIIHMINYGLFLSAEYPNMGRKWCTNMEFDVDMQRFYCFSDCHIFCYNIRGDLLLEIPHAHQSAVVSCVYSSHADILLTASRGTENFSADLGVFLNLQKNLLGVSVPFIYELKSWNEHACLLHVFQGHTKAVSKLLLHPSNTSLFISGSLDGSIKIWSFDSMQLFYSLSIFQEGVLWIGTLPNNLMYCSSGRILHVYDLNSLTSFWAHINSRISNLCLCRADGKSNRVVATGVDNSLRIFSLRGGTKLCTVLPPPFPSGLQPVLSFTYNRYSGTVYLLVTPWDIWVYTARTDPACRAAVWTTEELQQHLHRKHPLASSSKRCECLCSLSSPLCYPIDEGLVYADNQEFLVLGMQDGRILFLHTSIQNLVYYEMIVYKDPVIHLRHDEDHQQLVIVCQRTTSNLIHFRSLPALDLVYHIETSNDSTVFARLEGTLLAGLKSGAIEFYDMLTDDDQIEIWGKGVNNNGRNYKKNEAYCSENCHKGPVLAVDSCKNLSIFLSCGSDSLIKLWDTQKNVLAEITLDNTLSTACFLNSAGKILLAFKNDIYTMSLSKALGLSEADIDSSSVSAAESFIFESQPSNEQEGGKAGVSKSFEMNSYLVPYDGFTFSEDFTSDLLFLPKKKGKPDLRLPMAPSEVYCSPCDSEASLKIFDFLLQPRTCNLEEQDKSEMSKRMIMTKDMKYMPGPKTARRAHLEMPFFGISPCTSLIHQQPETQSKEKLVKVAEVQSELSIVESLQKAPNEQQQQANEETASETSEIMLEAESEEPSDKKETSEPLHQTGSFLSEKTTEMSSKTSTLFSRNKKHIPKKPVRREALGPKKLHIPKRARSVTKSAMRSRDDTYTSHERACTSMGGKVFFAPGTESLAPTEERPLSPRKTLPPKEKYESPYEKNIKRAVSWRRKENERIQQVEERRLTLSLTKSLCSRNRCGFTPNNSQQYLNQQSSEHLSEFTDWMKPYNQQYIRPNTVMEETTINLPRDFPYRLAWGSPATPDLDIKLYQPRTKFDKEGRSSTIPIDKNLQPTKSIPAKGRFILVCEPVSTSSLPAPTPLESKLLGVRFPRLKDKILQSLMSDMQESC